MRHLTIALLLASCTAAASRADDETTFTHKQDVVYGHKFGTALTMDVFTPKKDANGAAIVVVVSGGWVSNRDMYHGFYKPFATEFLKRGYTVFAVYHGAQPRYTIPEAVSDVNRAVRFIRHHAKDYGIAADRIGVTGGSAGGHLSLMQGTAGDKGDSKARDPIEQTSSRVQAVACLYPPTDFLNYGEKGKYAFAPDGVLAILRVAMDVRELDPKTKMLERVTDEKKIAELARKVSPIAHVTAETPPTLIIHGDADKIVPFQQAEAFVARLKDAGVPAELVVKKGGGHGWGGMDKDIGVLADWFDKYLNKK